MLTGWHGVDKAHKSHLFQRLPRLHCRIGTPYRRVLGKCVVQTPPDPPTTPHASRHSWGRSREPGRFDRGFSAGWGIFEKKNKGAKRMWGLKFLHYSMGFGVQRCILSLEGTYWNCSLKKVKFGFIWFICSPVFPWFCGWISPKTQGHSKPLKVKKSWGYLFRSLRTTGIPRLPREENKKCGPVVLGWNIDTIFLQGGPRIQL